VDSFIFAINAVLPIVITVLIGYLLKKIGIMNDTFSKSANKLVFKLFLPSMLFLNVFKINNFSFSDVGYIFYVVAAVVMIFILAIPLVIAVTKKNERRGVLLQCCFRSNFALIGIPIAQSLFGDEGVVVATLLSAVAIPLFNILAVISLSIFSSEKSGFSIKKVLLDIIKNPLIQSIFAGLLALIIKNVFGYIDFTFESTPIYKVLQYLSSVATPMSLLVLGAQFEFSAIKTLKKEIVFGTAFRVAVVPLMAIGTALLLGCFDGAHFAAFIAVFATPVAVSSVPMSQEMGGDVSLAGQLVVWTTIFSSLSVFVYSFVLSLLNVF